MKYIRVEWPEIQDYMGLDDFLYNLYRNLYMVERLFLILGL